MQHLFTLPNSTIKCNLCCMDFRCYSHGMETPRWLLFLYQVPSTPSTHRAYAWRKLKAIGALYLQNSICLLPSRDELRGRLGELRDEISARGGEASLLELELVDKGECEAMICRFDEQVGDEYGEFLEQCGDFHAELRKERDKKHLTFGELEENEAEIDKLRSWLPRILARDFFDMKLKAAALAALEKCERDFSLFERQVEAAELRKQGE